MATYKLTYFDAKGRAEFVRWIFAAAGQKYEDNRLAMGPEWGQLKPTTPFGSLPILETDGVTLAQTSAIALFLAKRFNLAGKTDVEQAQVHMIMECVSDMRTAYLKTKFGSDENKAAAQKKWAEEEQQQFLAKLEKLLDSKSSYFVGGKMTLADIVMVDMLDRLSGVDYTSYPGLKKNKANVEANPGIAKWLASRPNTMF